MDLGRKGDIVMRKYSDFTQALAKKFSLEDEAADALEDMSYESMLEFFECMIPSGDFYHPEESSPRVQLAVDHCEESDLRAFAPACFPADRR